MHQSLQPCGAAACAAAGHMTAAAAHAGRTQLLCLGLCPAAVQALLAARGTHRVQLRLPAARQQLLPPGLRLWMLQVAAGLGWQLTMRAAKLGAV